jgi:hypothetical protein
MADEAPERIKRIARGLTKGQKRAVLFLATLGPLEWRSPTRETFSSSSADCLVWSMPLVEWSFMVGERGGREVRLTPLGRRVATALSRTGSKP